MTNIDLNQIRVFISVVDHGSFSAASDELSMPRATVSRKVSMLEDSLGIRLLHRSTRKLNLTDAGQDYYERCHIALGQIDEANDTLSEAQQKPGGTLRIAAPLAAQKGFMCDWINQFARAYPAVKLQVLLSDDRVDMIGEGIDVAFRAGHLENSNLIAQKLGSTDLILCASPEYLDTTPPLSQLRDIKKHRCIVFGHANEKMNWRLKKGSKSVMLSIEGYMQVNSMEFALESCLASLGIALLPRTMVEKYIKQNVLTHVLPGYSTTIGGIYVVYADRRHLSASARALIELVIDAAKGGLPINE